MAYLLGIDGGGSHTTAWLADEHFRVFAKAEAGASNPIKVGLARAQREILRAVREVRRRAQIHGKELDAVCVGLAGAGSPPLHDQLLRWLRKSVPARSHLLTIDAVIALAAADESTGIIVISGTGSIAYGRDDRGHVLRAGGWGSVFDDAGSGYDIGRKAIAGALRAVDGRDKPTRLTNALTRALKLGAMTDVVAKPLASSDIAALFPIILREAEAGDTLARQLCRDAGCDLADLALALVTRFGWKDCTVPILCSGGVFQSSSLVRRSFARRVHARAPRARVSLLLREPVEGALRLARQLL